MVGSRRSCKGICHRYKASGFGGARLYRTGHKRCNVCEYYFKTDKIRCICCGNLLRTKPRNGKYKEPFRIYVKEVK